MNSPRAIDTRDESTTVPAFRGATDGDFLGEQLRRRILIAPVASRHSKSVRQIRAMTIEEGRKETQGRKREIDARTTTVFSRANRTALRTRGSLRHRDNNPGTWCRDRESSIRAIVGSHHNSLKTNLHGSLVIIILDESSKSERIVQVSCCLDVSSEAYHPTRRSIADALSFLNSLRSRETRSLGRNRIDRAHRERDRA